MSLPKRECFCSYVQHIKRMPSLVDHLAQKPKESARFLHSLIRALLTDKIHTAASLDLLRQLIDRVDLGGLAQAAAQQYPQHWSRSRGRGAAKPHEHLQVCRISALHQVQFSSMLIQSAWLHTLRIMFEPQLYLTSWCCQDSSLRSHTAPFWSLASC